MLGEPLPPGDTPIFYERTTILPVSGWSLPDLGELWRYRDLLFLLTSRNIAIIYRQSILGIGWAVFRPLVTTVIFTVVFGRFAGFADKSITVPYPLFVYAALVIWNLFAASLANTSESVVAQANLLTKTYFPRLLLPVSAVGVATIDFAVQFLLLFALMWYYDVAPMAFLVVTPLFFLATTIAALSLGVWSTALNVRFRDVKHVIPFFIQTLFFLTPVIYPSSFVPKHLRWLLCLNPMFSIVEAFRWSTLATPPPDWILFAVSFLITCIVLVGGLIFFRRTESTFADII